MRYSDPAPKQEEGSSSDTFHTVHCDTKDGALNLFSVAEEKLLNVNEWANLAGAASADFQLTDAQGHAVDRSVQRGDHFRIGIPGPGNADGEGYDWVEVEKVEKIKTEEELLTYIQVRPTSHPRKAEDAIAHFFDDDATSTFSVRCTDATVTASVQGRNEKPNTDTEGALTAVRNTIVSVTAIAGFSKLQWKQLVKGILGEK